MLSIGCYKERSESRWRRSREESKANEAVLNHNERKMMFSAFHWDTLNKNTTTAIIKSSQSFSSSKVLFRNLDRKHLK